MFAFRAFLAHESPTFRGPNSEEKNEIVHDFSEKSRIFVITLETIFVTIGPGKVKKNVENR